MTFHTLPLFSLPLKIYVSYMHIKIVTGEIHPNSGKSMFCIQNSEDFDCKVVSLTLVQVNC